MNALDLPTRFFRYLVALCGFQRPAEASFDTAPDTAFWGTYTPPPAQAAPTSQAVAAKPGTVEFAGAAEEPSVQPRLRTLEEVRADLARLRERTRAQHAAAEEKRDLSFAPTDFMDFAGPAASQAEAPVSAFAPTDFLDFGAMNLRPGR